MLKIMVHYNIRLIFYWFQKNWHLNICDLDHSFYDLLVVEI